MNKTKPTRISKQTTANKSQQPHSRQRKSFTTRKPRSRSSSNKQTTTTSIAKIQQQQQQRPFSSDALGFSWPVSKSLDGVVNLERFATQSPEIIDQLWSDYHAASSTATGISITSDEFEKLKQRGANTSFFIHPIPRDGGFFVMLSQYQDKSFLLTYLEDYKQKGMKAQPYMTITIYDELQHSKDKVLVRSDICALATLNKRDSDFMTRTLINAYTDDAAYNDVFAFNKQSDQFDFQAYIDRVAAAQV